MTGADKVSAPKAGRVKLETMTNATVLDVDLGSYVTDAKDIRGYWTFRVTVDCHFLFGNVDVPDPDTTDDADGDEPWPVSANTDVSFYVDGPESRHLRVLPSADGVFHARQG